jgi:hypothetical protein
MRELVVRLERSLVGGQRAAGMRCWSFQDQHSMPE